MSDGILCSVIMPAYNCQSYIAEAISSVLRQEHILLELIIIDDCSDDQTYSVAQGIALEEPRVRLYRNSQNIGVAATRNRGFDLAGGEYIALLDADDIWFPGKLATQLQLMEQQGGNVCYSSYSFIDEHGKDIRTPYIVPVSFTYSQFLMQNYIGCSTAIFSRSLLEGHRMCTAYAHEDYVFWLELLQSGAVACGVSEPLVKYRVLSSGRSADKGKAAQNRWKIYREFLKLNPLQAAYYFTGYTLLGFRKHFLS